MNTQNLENMRVNVDAEVDRLLRSPFSWVKTLLTDDDVLHLKNIANSVVLTRKHILHGGGFVDAIVANNLYLAVMRADNVMIKCLPILAAINEFEVD